MINCICGTPLPAGEFICKSCAKAQMNEFDHDYDQFYSEFNNPYHYPRPNGTQEIPIDIPW